MLKKQTAEDSESPRMMQFLEQAQVKDTDYAGAIGL
jgi:hypothetical protein